MLTIPYQGSSVAYIPFQFELWARTAEIEDKLNQILDKLNQ